MIYNLYYIIIQAYYWYLLVKSNTQINKIKIITSSDFALNTTPKAPLPIRDKKQYFI